MADKPFAGGDSRLVLLVVELGDVLLPLKHDLDSCVDLFLLLGVERVAERLERSADRFAHIGKKGHAALERG